MLRPRLLTAALLAAATPAFALTATGAPKADDNATAHDVFVDPANQKNDTGIATAPPLPVTRRSVELERFQYRLVASKMTTDEKGVVTPLPEVRPVDSPWKW